MQPRYQRNVQRLRVLIVLMAGLSVGCRSMHRNSWSPPQVAQPSLAFCCQANLPSWRVAETEAAYACAVELEMIGDAGCVDHYYRAATLIWPDIEYQLSLGIVTGGRVAELYRSALTKLITTGQSFGRLDPRHGLSILTQSGWLTVPTMHYGFPRPSDEFDHLIPVGEYRSDTLNEVYASPGLGVPTVAMHTPRQPEPFRRQQQLFAATVVLRPSACHDSGVSPPFILELFDPLRVSTVTIGERSVPLARDITAPMVYGMKDETRNFITEFIQPGSSTANQGLFMIEPYQPGKIPILFVHGLLSDRFTWANIANEIRARPHLEQRYQIWGFEYATGEPFFGSAALLRRQLRELNAWLDPLGADPALSHVVLVGHSMGGLVAKLQVTCSGDIIWRSVANRPLESILTSAETRRKLAEACLFNPSPMISRVIYVGTPHRGSPCAQRLIGKVGSSLVEKPSSMQSEHEQLVRDNPCTFSPEFSRRIPTSIDLLRSDSAMLNAMDQLPVAAHVRLHSIIGSYRPMIGAGDSDGIVPVSSTRQRGVISERVIPAKHTKLHQDIEGIAELLRILEMHLSEG